MYLTYRTMELTVRVVEKDARKDRAEKVENGQVRAAARAFDVLACFTVAKPGATLSEIASLTGLAITTTSRMLATLEAAHLVRRFGDGQYGVGSRLIQLGLTALATSLYEVAGPHLSSLAKKSGETANIGVLNEDGQVMYLRQVESRHAVRHVTWVGRTVPVVGTAIGAAFNGKVGPSGIVHSRATLEPDVTAIAAPVYGAMGQTIAALSITGPSFRIDDDAVERYGRLLVVEATALSRTVGGNGLGKAAVRAGQT